MLYKRYYISVVGRAEDFNAFLHVEKCFSMAPNTANTIEERISWTKGTFTKFDELFQDSETAGVSSAVSTYLVNQHFNLLCDTDLFVASYYPLIWFHMFCSRGQEQITYPMPFLYKQVRSESTLSKINGDIAYLAHFHFNPHKYLAQPTRPLIKEIFVGLDFLSRLYTISVGHEEARKRFVKLMRDASKLSDDYIMALWKFRCGLVHSGVLYTKEGDNVWRFGYEWQKDILDRVIIDDTTEYPESLGKHYTVNVAGLFKLYTDIHTFVQQDMRDNCARYLTHKDFPKWVERFWTISYLHSQKDFMALVTRSLQAKGIEQPQCECAILKIKIPLFSLLKQKLIKARRFPPGSLIPCPHNGVTSVYAAMLSCQKIKVKDRKAGYQWLKEIGMARTSGKTIPNTKAMDAFLHLNMLLIQALGLNSEAAARTFCRLINSGGIRK